MSGPWWQGAVAPLDEAAEAAAWQRQGALTKPPGALGRLETLACWFAARQGEACPGLERIHISVFAADHGVTDEGISRFPQAVTREMVRNFVAGGAAVSVLARQWGAALEVVDAGVATDTSVIDGIHRVPVAPGTANLAEAPAMDAAQCERALALGREAVARAGAGRAQLFIGGEMGIGNTTAATALACALLGAAPSALAGPGTGLDAAGVAHKARVIERALALHAPHTGVPLQALRRLGGFEIAALAGAFIAAAQAGLPVLVDGYIAGVAALVARQLCPQAERWWLYGHRSGEPGHGAVLAALGAEPLLELGMRLGEGSGAAVAVGLLKSALALHGRMATFAEAGVSGASA